MQLMLLFRKEKMIFMSISLLSLLNDIQHERKPQLLLQIWLDTALFSKLEYFVRIALIESCYDGPFLLSSSYLHIHRRT